MPPPPPPLPGAFYGLLNTHNPNIGFFKHAPITHGGFSERILAGQVLTPVDHLELVRRRRNIYTGTFHYKPGVYSGLHGVQREQQQYRQQQLLLRRMRARADAKALRLRAQSISGAEGGGGGGGSLSPRSTQASRHSRDVTSEGGGQAAARSMGSFDETAAAADGGFGYASPPLSGVVSGYVPGVSPSAGGDPHYDGTPPRALHLLTTIGRGGLSAPPAVRSRGESSFAVEQRGAGGAAAALRADSLPAAGGGTTTTTTTAASFMGGTRLSPLLLGASDGAADGAGAARSLEADSMGVSARRGMAPLASIASRPPPIPYPRSPALGAAASSAAAAGVTSGTGTPMALRPRSTSGAQQRSPLQQPPSPVTPTTALSPYGGSGVLAPSPSASSSTRAAAVDANGSSAPVTLPPAVALSSESPVLLGESAAHQLRQHQQQH